MKVFVLRKDKSVLGIDNESGFFSKVVLDFYGPGMHELYDEAVKHIEDMEGQTLEDFVIETHVIVPEV